MNTFVRYSSGSLILLFGLAVWAASFAVPAADAPATVNPAGPPVATVPSPASPAPAAAAPAPGPTAVPAKPAAGVDMSSIFGPGSQLQAAPEGEFNISIGADNELQNFHAVKDVILITKDIDLRCDEMDFDRPKGILVATAPNAGQVHINMRGAQAPASPTGAGPSDTRATCGRFEYYLNDKRYVLTLNPVIFQKDKTNKETAIVGDRITVTQDDQGRSQMHVKGNPGIVDPKQRDQLNAIRQKMNGSSKPVLNLDTQAPKVKSAPSPPGKPVKIDEGNVEKVQQPKSPRVINLEEGD